MTWVCERVGSTMWKKMFLSMKGSDVFLYETPPVRGNVHALHLLILLMTPIHDLAIGYNVI